MASLALGEGNALWRKNIVLRLDVVVQFHAVIRTLSAVFTETRVDLFVMDVDQVPGIEQLYEKTCLWSCPFPILTS